MVEGGLYRLSVACGIPASGGEDPLSLRPGQRPSGDSSPDPALRAWGSNWGGDGAGVLI
jgi:hypothetical protein